MSEDHKNVEPRVKTVEEAVLLLTQMALRADERMDGFEAAFSNITAKLEALADAQIRTEESLTHLSEVHARLAEAQKHLAEAQKHLAESQAHTDKRLDALIDIVREDREGRSGK
jgi:exonuclease VII small subunit